MNTKEIRSPELPAPAIDPAAEQVVKVHEAALDDLRGRAQQYVDRARAPGTLRGYDSAWRRFAAWCSRRDLCPLPAGAETVALFLAELADTLHAATLGRYVSAIKLRHDAAGHPSPTLDVRVRSVVRGIRREHGVAPNRQSSPLLVGDLISIVETLDPVSLIDLRDKALLLLGFAAALRRSEIVNLEVEDLAFRADGLVVRLRRSKTDQEGSGRAIGVGYGNNGTCPVVAVRSWLTASGVSTGAAFRSVDRHGHVGRCRLNAQTVCRVVKKLVPRVGLDPRSCSGHALRSGFATSAAAAGIGEREIAKITGHKSLEVLRQYIRDGEILDGDIVRRLGL